MTQPRPTRVRSAEFRALFRAIVGATLASGCTACASEADAEGGRYAFLECEADGRPKLATSITTTPRVDALAVYARDDLYPTSPTTDLTFSLIASSGSLPCATGQLPCVEALKSAMSAPPCAKAPGPCPAVAVYLQGDQWVRFQNREDLTAFFGEIDSVAEAVLLASFDRRELHCKASNGNESGKPTRIGVYQDADGFHIQSEYDFCYTGARRERYTVSPDGSIRDEQTQQLTKVTCAIGRRPIGVCGAHPARERGEAAGFLAELAELEAASVFAFRQIADELIALDAPQALVAASRAALCDEVRHADVMARLARRFGGSPQVPNVPASALRSAFALACDNAGEGCVRETFGALLARYQAANVRDDELKAAFTTIAEDETRHAQLSWELAAWLEPRLSEIEQREVERVRMAAVETLRGELALGLSDVALRELGLPDEAVAVAMFTRLRDTIWT